VGTDVSGRTDGSEPEDTVSEEAANLLGALSGMMAPPRSVGDGRAEPTGLDDDRPEDDA
jgi:hypothetical protein